MTTGASIYLVSACSSGEEFVAAFRRYADRTGLFIPVSEPLPAGRRGRVALTLKDGGVMVEGEAEVIASSPKPSALHGRIGMTIRFVDPDEPSKIVLGELEKARLAMKPAPPSVLPRPSEIPAEPRPVPPPTGGRIDANNALAECVMIGDLATLRDGGGSKAAADAAAPPKASQKFVIPSIPQGGGRPKSPSTPPEPRPRTPSTAPEPSPKTPSTAPEPNPKTPSTTPEPSPKTPSPKTPSTAPEPSPKTPSTAPEPSPKTPSTAPALAISPRSTTLGIPALDKKPAITPVPLNTVVGVAPMSPAATAPTPVTAPSAIATSRTTTSPGMSPQAAASARSPSSDLPSKNPALAQKIPAGTPVPPSTVPGTAAPTRKDPTPVPAGRNRATVMGPAVAPPRADVVSSTPTRDDANTRSPFRADPPKTAPAGNQSRSKSATSPPRFPTPVAPLPVTRLPAQPAQPILGRPVVTPIAEIDLAEPTDLSSVPTPPTSATDPHLRRTSVGEAVAFDASTVDSGRAFVPDPSPLPSPPADTDAPTDFPIPTTRASQILAAIPSGGDWTMTPDASGPTVLPASEKVAIPEPTPAPGPAPTGDWTISLADNEGWDQPSWSQSQPLQPKPRGPAQAATPKTGNPVFSVASDKPLSSEAPEDRPTAIEPKVEIDPTLMEPLKPMPIDEDDEADELAPPPMPTLPGMGGPIPQRLAPTPVAMELGAPAPGPMPNSYVTRSHGLVPMGRQPAQMPPQMMGFPPLQQRQVADGGAGFFSNENAQVPRYPSDAPPAIEPANKRKRTMMIIAGVAVIVAMIVTLIALVTGGADKRVGDTRGSGSAHAIVKPTSGTVDTSRDVAVVDPTHPKPKRPDAAVAAVKCSVELSTVPPAAEVALDGSKDHILGTTPMTFELPCDVETKLYIRKAKYNGVIKPVTATAETARVTVKLQKQTFSLKVTSSPAGATISVGGKSMGVTPTTIKVVAFDTTAITLSKDGYAPDTQKIPVKQNNAAHHVILKKVGSKKLH